MDASVLDALQFLLRWLHLVAGIAWIGESFYFVALDRGLSPSKQTTAGLAGESWSVHGGGFYLKQKYLPAPQELPAQLHWSKWKSYTTWLSGFALFSAMYLASPNIYLVDPAIYAFDPRSAVLAAIAFLLGAWLSYDAICRLLAGRDELLSLLLGLLVLALCYLATAWFSGRAAFLLVGAALGTIMSANVFFIIIPGQKRLVAALQNGARINPIDGQRGKQRSVHNTYFTLPVVFAMLSNHLPNAYAHANAGLILALFLVAAALIRHFFVVWHSGERAWGTLVGSGALLLIGFVWIAPRVSTLDPTAPSLSSAEILPIVITHCGGCHGAAPALLASAPKGVILDSQVAIEAHAAQIYAQVNTHRIMPPGNLTGLSEVDRATIGAWATAHINRATPR